VSAFDPFTGDTECFRDVRARMTHSNTIRVIAAEPTAALRIAVWAADMMHRADGWTQPTLGGRVGGVTRALNAWFAVKSKVFPRSGWLWLFVAGLAATCGAALRQAGFPGQLAYIGFVSTIGCATEIAVAVLGDGTGDPRRHLFLANVLFDLAVLACANLIIVAGLGGGRAAVWAHLSRRR
jgi:hypothetical protein